MEGEDQSEEEQWGYLSYIYGGNAAELSPRSRRRGNGAESEAHHDTIRNIWATECLQQAMFQQNHGCAEQVSHAARGIVNYRK